MAAGAVTMAKDINQQNMKSRKKKFKKQKQKLFRANEPFISVFYVGSQSYSKRTFLYANATSTDARRLQSLLKNQNRQPHIQQREPTKPLQSEGILSCCLQKIEGIVWCRRKELCEFIMRATTDQYA